MKQLLEDLTGVLNEEALIYEDILKLSRNKTNIIVEGKITELEKIVKLEQTLVLNMAKLEAKRETLIFKVSSAIGKKPEEITVSNLIESVGSVHGKELKGAQEKLAGLIKELNNANELNARLLINSLDYINFSLNLIATADNGVNNYGVDGEKSDSKARNFFDLKI